MMEWLSLKDWLYIGSMATGFAALIFRQGKLFGEMMAHQRSQDERIDEFGEEVKSMKKILSPDKTAHKLVTLEWCDRQQAGCSGKRTIEMNTMRSDIAEIKDMARGINGTLKIVGETLARLDERTSGGA